MFTSDSALKRQTRRHFFRDCQMGLGSMALGGLLERGQLLARDEQGRDQPLSPQEPHFEPRAKNVIFLFMAGGPSQLELFEPKPKLQQLSGQVIPQSFVENKRFAFLKKDAKLMGTRRQFRQHGQAGHTFSECLPHLASISDELSMIRSMTTDVFNHGPAKFFMNTGFNRFGRPSMGAWVTYGIGSEANDLPGFVSAPIRASRTSWRSSKLGEWILAHYLPGSAVPRQRRPDS